MPLPAIIKPISLHRNYEIYHQPRSMFVCRACIVVVCASGRRSNRQAGSERAEHEPALPRVWGAKLASPALPGGSICRQRARLSTQQQQPSTKRVRRLRRQDRRAIPSTRPRQILAPRLSQMHMLRTSFSGHGQIFLFQRRNDTVQKRLHKVSTGCLF